MKTGAAIVGFAISGVLGLWVGYTVGFNGKSGTINLKPSTASANTNAAAPAADDIYKVPIGTSPIKGSPDALITVVEFSDFECPFCARVLPTLEQIKREYGDKTRLVFKQNPLPFHQHAQPAAEFAVAAADQGKFWEMHDKLFANRESLDGPQIEKYASEVGVDVPKAKAFIESGKAKEIVQAEQALAAKIGARGTPAFFINGIRLSGAQPFENFKKVIDQELTKAGKMADAGVDRKDIYERIMTTAKDTAPAPVAQQQQQEAPVTRQSVELVEGVPSRGGTQPLVTIVEWSDFECPFCSRAIPTIQEVLKTYGDKVALQFRHQPLSFHPHAMPAAKAAVAAGKQGKFWEMHDKLYENQRALAEADFDRYAEELHLNIAKWKADMVSPEVEAQIKRDMDAGAKYGARGTPSFFINGVPVRGAQPFAAFKSVIDDELARAEKLLKEGVPRKDVYAEVMKREAGKPAAPPSAPQAAAPAEQAKPADVKIGRAPAKGPKGAPVEVVMYSDFQCPFCGRVNPSIDQLSKEYGKNLRIAFKQFPLPFHQNAELAAIASLAAHRQGKFWEMHTKLFANQSALLRENLVGYAKELGLDAAKFEKDLDDPELKAWVKADIDEGQKHGVNGTPATFINGRLVSGAQAYDAFKTIVEEELKKKKS